MQRYDIIKYLIEKHEYKSYLEIGVLGNETFNSLPPLQVKHSVDPNGQAMFSMPSDDFFAYYCTHSYDLIFIDGLHLAEQAQRDIENSLTHLNKNGIIVVHDCLPTEEWHQLRKGIDGKPWTGDVWKAFAAIRATRFDLKMQTVDTDWGCGLIARRTRELQCEGPVEIGQWDWPRFKQHRDIIMGVITVQEFLNGCW